MKIFKELTFDAAHYLPNHKGKCKNMHGHTYRVKIGLKGTVDQIGMVFDFGRLNEILQKEIIEVFDHKNLNNFIENPTAENIASRIAGILLKNNEIKYKFYSIELWETPTSSVKIDYLN